MKILKISGGILLLLATVLVVNTLRLEPVPPTQAAQDLAVIDTTATAQRLAGALRIPTITRAKREEIDWSRWPVLHDYLVAQYPGAHRALTRETVNQYSLLYTWPGSDAAAKPVLLLAHQDVVPVEPGTEKVWQQPPFDGVIADGFVWGRGAIDDKASLMAQLEAVELLASQGFKPRRTVYLAFGHDEEIGGREGARKLAALLEERGVKAEFSLDEGGAMTQGVIAGVARPVATIATAEKGYVSFRLTARDAGGHSSRPPKATAVGRLAHAVAHLEKDQFPVRLAPPVDEMLLRIAPELPFARRVALANLWLFRPLVARQMAEAGRLPNAQVRTTTAPTMFNAGIKDNVLPSEASAVVNFRVLPGDTVAGVEAHIRRVIADDAIELAPLDFSSEPSAVADPATAAFLAIERTVNEVFPDAIVATGLVIGATDNRHYGAVREARYNFLPLTLRDDDVTRMHGANERVAVADYARMVQFYERLLRNIAGN